MALLRLGSTGPLLKTDTGLIDNSVTYAPGAVTTIAGSVTSSTIQFSWTAPAGQPPFTYTPQYKLHTDPTFINMATTNSLTATATGLVASAQYDVRTIATNPYGTSTNNVIATVTTAPIGGAAPTAPSNLAVQMAQTTATVTFNASTGTAPISYVAYDRVSNSSAQFTSVAAGSASPLSITGLTPGVTYDFEVIATNQYGTTTSQVITGTTSSGTIVQPGTVTLTANNVTTTTVDIAWQTPTGTAPFTYVLQYKAHTASTFTSLAQQSTTGVSITGLLPNTAYDLSLSTTNNAGTSTSLGTFTTAVAATPPGGITVTLVSATSSTVIVQWTTPSGTTPFTYTPSYRLTNTGAYTAIATTSGLQATFSGLTAGVIYDFKVDVAGPGGNNTSNVLTTQTVPAGVIPSAVTANVTGVGLTTIGLSWTQSTGTLPITYTPQIRVSGTQTFAPIARLATTNTFVTIDQLTTGTTYDITIFASNSAGTNTQGTVVTQAPSAGTAPSAPVVTVGAMGYNYANLSWTASTGSQPITYTPQYKRTVDTTFLPASSITPSSSDPTPYTTVITGLIASTQYDFRISATNASGGPVNGTSQSGTTTVQPAIAGPITDIVFTPPTQPLSPNMDFGIEAINNAIVVGSYVPVGGIGPYVYSLGNNPSNYYPSDPKHGFFYQAYGSQFFHTSLVSDSLELVITDRNGRGTTFRKTVQIPKQANPAGPYIFPSQVTNLPNTYPNINFYYGYSLDPTIFGGATNMGNAKIVSDPRGGFQDVNGTIEYKNGVAPAVGAYPLTVSRTCDQGTFTTNMTVNIIPAVISQIEFTPVTVSTSLPIGTHVGYAYCSTPYNDPRFSLSDSAGGKYVIDQITGEVTVYGALTAQTDHITIVCTEELTTSRTFAIPVAQGNILPPTNMTLAVPTTLDNATPNQTIGTPVVTGISGTKLWIISAQTNFNSQATSSVIGIYGGDARYQIDSSTGLITCPPLLSFQTDQITVSCSDGINTCVQTFNIPVHETTETTTYYVGRGMATLHPGFGYEKFSDITPVFMAAHHDKKIVKIYPDSDPDYYTADFGIYQTGDSWSGPLRFEGQTVGSLPMPRFGGKADNTGRGYGNPKYGTNKGIFVMGPGDIEWDNIAFTNYWSGTTDHAVDFIRKESVYGNLTVTNCVFSEGDQGIKTGPTHSILTVDHCEFTNVGGAVHDGSGPAHNLYVEIAKLVFTNNISRGACQGHTLKSRAMINDIHGNTFLDGFAGSSSCLIDCPPFGVDTHIYNNVFVKGPMAQNPSAVQIGANDGLSPSVYDPLHCLIENNTFINFFQVGSHAGTSSCIANFFEFDKPKGIASTMVVQNNSYWQPPGANLITTYFLTTFTLDTDPTHQPTLTNNTALALPPNVDLTRKPASLQASGTIPPSDTIFWHTLYGQDYYNNFEGVMQVVDRDYIYIPHTSTVGTVLCNMRAKTDINTGLANVFGPGTTWSIIQDPVYYSFQNPNPWAPIGRYSVTANSDGTASLKVAGTLATGVDYVQIRAVAPGGARTSDQRYPIVIT